MEDACLDLIAVARVRRLAKSGQARRIRERAGVSQRELALALGVSEFAVYTWERGEHAPEARRAERYARLLEELKRLTEPKGQRER